MVIYCFVEGRKSSRYKGKNDENHIDETFYGFPTNPELREKWIGALFTLNKQESARRMPKTSKICKLHFSNDCFEQFGFSHVRLKPNSIPSKFPRMQNDSLNKSTVQNNLPEEVHPLKINVDNMDNKRIKLSQEDNINSTILVKEVENTNSMIPKKTFMDRLETENMEIENIETENMQVELQHNTPEHEIRICKTPTKKLRYPGDINENTIKDMTPRAIVKSVKILKQACVKKDITIKRLRNEQTRQKKKIESLQKLLTDLKQKCLLSSNSANIVEVWFQQFNKFKF